MSEKENLMARNFDDIPLINANHNEFATNVFCLMGQLIKGYEKYWTKDNFYFIQEMCTWKKKYLFIFPAS